MVNNKLGSEELINDLEDDKNKDRDWYPWFNLIIIILVVLHLYGII